MASLDRSRVRDLLARLNVSVLRTSRSDPVRTGLSWYRARQVQRPAESVLIWAAGRCLAASGDGVRPPLPSHHNWLRVHRAVP